MIRLTAPLVPALSLMLACTSAGAAGSEAPSADPQAPTEQAPTEQAPTAQAEQAREQQSPPNQAPAEPAPGELAQAAPSGGALGDPPSEGDPELAAATAWQTVLTNYVTADGGFRYEALMASAADMANLDTFVAWAAGVSTTGWSRESELAFLINAYNANTVKSVVDLWPVESVLSEEGFFDGRQIVVAGMTLTLNGLENDQIRARFGEPRIHFLVNCASVGCPWLINERVHGDNLEALLERQATSYVRRTSAFDRETNTATVSAIFDWFAGDFEAGGGVRAFLAARLPDGDAAFVTDESTTIAFAEYDWNLNGR